MSLFVADDHPLILDTIKGVLQALDPGTEVTIFSTVDELELALGGDEAPDLVLIDFDMPGLASVQAVADFIRRHREVKVAVISGHVDVQLARDLIGQGSLGFVPKSLAPTAYIMRSA